MIKFTYNILKQIILVVIAMFGYLKEICEIAFGNFLVDFCSMQFSGPSRPRIDYRSLANQFIQ